MSKKKKNLNQERNPLQMVIYIGLVAALMAGLVALVMLNRKKQEAFADQVQELAAQETEMVMTERQTVKETEVETETAVTETAATEAADLSSAVLVLNGTKRPGVAGAWKIHLESKGYTNVHTASYTQASDQTMIYTNNAALGEQLKAEFTQAVVQSGSVESGIEAEAGDLLPAQIDAYVILGKMETTIQ